VEDLLSLSRIESGLLRIERRPIDLSDLAQAAIKRAGPELDRERLRLAVGEGEALVDGALVARLAANLLRNAARYSPADEAVEFTLEARLGLGGKALLVRVRDRGPGMSEEDLGRVFDKFSRSRGAKGKGLGLGLAICRGIAEAHGGSVSARVAEGGGLEVEAALPFSEEAGT
jgi:two-component system, OmpR family, sensor histidine kinase KdpD